jgi:hypothetical protein
LKFRPPMRDAPATQLDGFEFDVFPPRENGLTPTEVNIGGSQVAKTFMVAPRVVVGDELGQARFGLSRQVVVLEQDLVLHRTVITFDPALGHRMIRMARENFLWGAPRIHVALFDILPEIFALHGGSSYMPFAAVGFLAFFGLERYTAMHRVREHIHMITTHEQELGALSAGGLALHSFLDGIAIGVGFQTSTQIGLLIALGIVTHDLSDGLNTVTSFWPMETR